MVARFSMGETQTDSFSIHVMPRSPVPAKLNARIALFDPKGETNTLLTAMGVVAEPVDTEADLSNYDMLIVGKAALTIDGPAPRIGRVRDGLKVILFEQTSDVLEKRLGFRVQEYGLRQVFPRIAEHPLLAGICPSTCATGVGRPRPLASARLRDASHAWPDDQVV